MLYCWFKGMNNLLVLARDSETGAAQVWSDGKIVEPLLKMMTDKSLKEELVIAATRLLDELSKKSDRVGLRKFCFLFF